MQIKINPGHSLFKLNLQTGEIIKIPNDSIIEKGILYTSALNTKNAKKRFEKMVEYLIEIAPKSKEELDDKLCEYCPLEKKGVYSVDGGYMAGCEGSRCNDAYDNYLNDQGES